MCLKIKVIVHSSYLLDNFIWHLLFQKASIPEVPKEVQTLKKTQCKRVLPKLAQGSTASPVKSHIPGTRMKSRSTRQVGMVNNAPENGMHQGWGHGERRGGGCAFFFLRGMFLFPSRKAATAHPASSSSSSTQPNTWGLWHEQSGQWGPGCPWQLWHRQVDALLTLDEFTILLWREQNFFHKITNGKIEEIPYDLSCG